MINFYYSYYKDSSPSRQSELDYCFDRLLENKNIDNVFLLDGRPTFRDYMRSINEHTGSDDVNVFLNSDCFFDESACDYLNQIPEGEFWALSRWNVRRLDPLSAELFQSKISQDAWAVRGPVKNLDEMDVDFALGTHGCERRMAFEAARFYKMRNPAKTVKLYHYHPSNVRYDSPELKCFKLLALAPTEL